MEQKIKLQQLLGVTQDGIIGVKTLEAFGRKYCKKPEQVAQFFANVHHETAGFTLSEELLTYTTPERIQKVWPSRFPTIESAIPFVRNPVALANKVYGNRMGNTKWDDGWRYRGQGALQLTGYDNYKSFSDWIGDPEIMTNPELVATKYYWESALYFFEVNKVWGLCSSLSTESIEKTRRKINGGLNGLKEVRQLITYYYKKW